MTFHLLRSSSGKEQLISLEAMKHFSLEQRSSEILAYLSLKITKTYHDLRYFLVVRAENLYIKFCNFQPAKKKHVQMSLSLIMNTFRVRYRFRVS